MRRLNEARQLAALAASVLELSLPRRPRDVEQRQGNPRRRDAGEVKLHNAVLVGANLLGNPDPHIFFAEANDLGASNLAREEGLDAFADRALKAQTLSVFAHATVGIGDGFISDRGELEVGSAVAGNHVNGGAALYGVLCRKEHAPVQRQSVGAVGWQVGPWDSALSSKLRPRLEDNDCRRVLRGLVDEDVARTEGGDGGGSQRTRGCAKNASIDEELIDSSQWSEYRRRDCPQIALRHGRGDGGRGRCRSEEHGDEKGRDESAKDGIGQVHAVCAGCQVEVELNKYSREREKSKRQRLVAEAN
ncbi:hypothetical protein B0I35DRAFT_444074 [Stachybotrys elegans]|uniref:Uncharacterized protein n=1 Tax=Stachybotrys elegans TaxID=80388 RepID=A0A8K0WM60_9HYPO|nr:hypothetical protein B0I35DRAFT_444074 [Stachybotrys elegans]